MAELFHLPKTARKRDSDSYSFIFRNFPFKRPKCEKSIIR